MVELNLNKIKLLLAFLNVLLRDFGKANAYYTLFYKHNTNST